MISILTSLDKTCATKYRNLRELYVKLRRGHQNLPVQRNHQNSGFFNYLALTTGVMQKGLCNI